MSSEKRSVFEALFKEYHPMVFQMCLGFVKGNRPQADDLAQEVFINIWTALGSFEGRSSHKTWIYRITVNTCLQFVRKDRKTEPIPDHGFDLSAERTENPSDEQTEMLYTAIGKLPETDRLIIMMVLDELSYNEISAVMGISEVNLRVKIHRIKSKLKTLMSHVEYI